MKDLASRSFLLLDNDLDFSSRLFKLTEYRSFIVIDTDFRMANSQDEGESCGHISEFELSS